MKHANPRKLQKTAAPGFSLVELLAVIAVLGVIAAISVASIGRTTQRMKINATAADFRTFQSAFLAYSHLEGGYPPDSHNSVPAGVGMETYLPQAAFERESPIGGRYNWEGPDNYTYAGISLTTTSATIGELQALDEILDDGNLSTGIFRRTPNGRYTFIIEDNI